MRTAICVSAMLASLVCACRARTTKDDGTPVVARAGGIPITAGDLKNQLGRLAFSTPMAARFSALEKRKELLDGLVRNELLAQEARRLGYAEDPAVKREMVNRMLQDQVEQQIKRDSIPEADIEKYYDDHRSDYMQAEAVRAAMIVVKDLAKAQKVAAEAKALPKSDVPAFRLMVAKYSEDQASRARNGDLGMFTREGNAAPAPVIQAAFALHEIHDVSDPVKFDKGYAIVKLTEKRPASTTSLADASSRIRTILLYERRNQRRNTVMDEIVKRGKVEIDEDTLAKVNFVGQQPSPSNTPGAPVPSGPASVVPAASTTPAKH